MKEGFHREAKLRKARKKRIVILEDLDFVWYEPELHELVDMWKNKSSILDMSKRFERDTDEILLALLHLARIDRISNREGGVLYGL